MLIVGAGQRNRSDPPCDEGGMQVATGGSRSTRGGLLSARATAWLAWSLCGLALALLAATLLVLLAGRPPATPAADAWQRQAADLLSLVGAPLLGGLIAARRPANRYGWLWLAAGSAMAVIAFAMAYAAVAQAAGPDGPPGLALAAWAFGLAFTAFLSLFPFVFLLFPNGRLPSRRWRLWAWAIIVVGASTPDRHRVQPRNRRRGGCQSAWGRRLAGWHL
jgi:cytochrome bd-type quinol oxidase subunit 2